MNVLIVGAGSLGQVFGLGLSHGGANVAYLVRPAQLSQARQGFSLYQLRHFRQPAPVRLLPSIVLADPTEASKHTWDAVWLCVHSTTLRDPWIVRLRDSIGDATIVTTGQDVRDRAVLEQVWPASQLVQVAPSFLAYPAPLSDEPIPASGTAYWLPPQASLAINGAPERAQPLVTLLSRGGLHAHYAKSTTGPMTAALTMPYMMVLEGVGWSLPALRRRLKLAASAAREASTVVAAMHNVRLPARFATSPRLAWLALILLARFTPFNLERYLQVHFHKVSDQTRQMLDNWIAEAHARQLPHVRLEELRSHLPSGSMHLIPDSHRV